MKFDWNEMLELLRYYRKGVIESEHSDYQGKSLAYWVGASDAAQCIAFALYPKEFNRYMFTEVLPLFDEGDEDNGNS